MKSITPFQCSPYSKTPLHCSPHSKCSWKARSITQRSSPPVHWPSCCPSGNRKCTIVMGTSDGNSNGDTKPSEEAAPNPLELSQQELMELEFGRLLGEDPKTTVAKVIGRKLNPDATYLDIEKSMKGRNSVRLKRRLQNSLVNAEEWQLASFPNIKSVSKTNTGKRESLNLVRPVIRSEETGVVTPTDPNRSGSHTKTLSMSSTSKSTTREVLLRKPSSPENKAREWEGKGAVSSIDQDRHGSHTKDHSTGVDSVPSEVLLRKPSSSGNKAHEWEGKGVASHPDPSSRGRHTKALSTGSDPKNIPYKVLLQKPPSPRSKALESFGFGLQHKTPLNLSSKKDDKLKTSLEDVGLLRRPEAIKIDHSLNKSPNDFRATEALIEDSLGSKTDNSSTYANAQKPERGDMTSNHKILLTRPSMPRNTVFLADQGTKEHIQDCKEDAEIEAGAQPTQQTSSIESELAKLEALIPTDSSSDHVSEANSIKTKSTECLDSHGYSLVNEIPGQHGNDVHNVINTGSDLQSCGQDSEERTYIGDGSEDISEKSFSQLANSIPSDHSDGVEDVSDKTVDWPTLLDSVLRKPSYQMVSLANSTHVKKFEMNVQTSDQNNETFSHAGKESEDHDWACAEILQKSGGFEEVELLSCNDTGFVVLFGSLLGLLPYRDLGSKRSPFPFEAWLRRKGVDPKKFQKHTGSESSTCFDNHMLTLGLTISSKKEETIEDKEEGSAAVMTKEYQNLLNLYNQDRTKFLSSFIGQRTRAAVILVDRISRRLLFSEKLRESGESAEKKASLMNKLNLGDIVTCQVARITSFGVFVDLEGVPALIHQSELSWDPVWDVNSYLKVGEVVKAKVCGLDHSRQRINLSLKQLKPDPLLGTLESVINENDDQMTSDSEHGELEKEWPEVESLIRELKLVDGIQSVLKGRFLLSPGLAPSFQVYLSESYGDLYKILARSGNRVQEIVVQASLDRDGIKSAIVSCTSPVAQEIGGQ